MNPNSSYKTVAIPGKVSNTISIYTRCDCGGTIKARCEGVGDVGMLTGVPCSECERTYTFTWAKDGQAIQGQCGKTMPIEVERMEVMA